MDPLALDNENPTKYKTFSERKLTREELDDEITDEIDAREVFDLIRNIKDPEHPLTLEELHVVELSSVVVKNDENEIRILFTPTVNHCSMAQLIGLAIRVKLLRSLPARFKVSVKIHPGSHVAEDAVNKQLADKERVAAAMENSYLISAINECIMRK